MSNDLTRPIVGIENRTAQEVFDIMCDRISRALPSPTGEKVEAVPVAWQRAYPDGEWSRDFSCDAASIAEWRSWGFESRALYSAETVAALEAGRDEARAQVEHFRTIYNTTVQTCQNRGRALATANARVERLEAENARLREYYEANEDVFRVGQLNATLKQFSRREDARAALTGGENDR